MIVSRPVEAISRMGRRRKRGRATPQPLRAFKARTSELPFLRSWDPFEMSPLGASGTDVLPLLTYTNSSSGASTSMWRNSEYTLISS